MQYILLKEKPGLYFKEYIGNRPIWTDSSLEAACYDWENALRIQLRLSCQSQVVKLIEVKEDLMTKAWNSN